MHGIIHRSDAVNYDLKIQMQFQSLYSHSFHYIYTYD